jgi:GDPmannose 4,6-dehydratase
MQWMMLQQPEADDYVIATGRQLAVRDFVTLAAEQLGLKLEFSGRGTDEIATVAGISGSEAPALKVGDVIVRVDPRYYRPAEVESLCGDATKAKENLGWVPEIGVEKMCSEMVAADLNAAKRNALLRLHGFDVNVAIENQG